MTHSTFRASALAVVAFSFIGAPLLLAQESHSSSITFEVRSPLSDMGKLELLDPTQESRQLPRGNHVLENPVPGDHTLFVSAPPGSTTVVELYMGTTLLKREEVPQLSFNIGLDDHLKIVVTYKLSAFGTIGISTDPPGMPFLLEGPGEVEETGISPVTFENMPVGSYGVRFTPKGCNTPPHQGNELQHGQKIYFTLTLHCDTFEPERDRSKDKNVGQLHLIDVRSEDWFAPYVFAMARLGIINGYKDSAGSPTGMFGPGDPVTLAQLSKIVHSYVGEEPRNIAPELLMHKSAANTWFQNYVGSAEEQDWRVFLDPNLDLNRPATRGEILVTFLQVLDIPLQWPKGNVFKDVNRRTPYASAIETSAGLGIVAGKSDAAGNKTGYFGPGESVTRAELAKILATLKDKYSGESSSSSK